MDHDRSSGEVSDLSVCYHWVFTVWWVTTIECSPCGESLPLSVHRVVSHYHWVFIVWWVTTIAECSWCGESLPLIVHCVVSHYHWLSVYCVVSHNHCWVFTVWWVTAIDWMFTVWWVTIIDWLFTVWVTTIAECSLCGDGVVDVVVAGVRHFCVWLCAVFVVVQHRGASSWWSCWCCSIMERPADGVVDVVVALWSVQLMELLML